MSLSVWNASGAVIFFAPAMVSIERGSSAVHNSTLLYENLRAHSAENMREFCNWKKRNGVRVSEFGPAPLKRAAARAQLHLAETDIAVLFLGSGWERKGLRFAVAAIESLRNDRMRLLVAGRGNRRRFRSRNARFFGEVGDVRPLLSAADIFLLPTLYDPFSNASLEAMAAGLPVVTTRANGCSEIIEERIHGSIVDRADNIAALGEALRFWSDESRRKKAQMVLLEHATEFDLSRHIAQTLETVLSYPEAAESTSGKMRKT